MTQKKEIKSAGIALNSMLRKSLLALLIPGLIACSDPEQKVEAFMKQGKAFYEEGENQKARIQFKNALQINPRLAEAYYTLALLDEQSRNWSGVYRNLNKVIEIQPERNDARLKLGQLYLLNREDEEALAQVDAILKTDPEDLDALTLRAAILFQQADVEGALELINSIFRQDGSFTDALALKITILLAKKDYAEAAKLLNQAIEKFPENRSFYLLQVRMHSEVKDLDALEQDLRKLITLFPEQNNFRVSLASLLRSQGQTADAETVMQEMIKANPEDQQVKLSLIQFVAEKDTARATALLEGYLKDNPKQNQLALSLAQYYRSQRDNARAEQVLNDFLKTDPPIGETSQIKTLLSSIYMQEGKRDKAKQLLDEVLVINKNDPDALLVRAALLLNDGKFDPAIKDLRSVLRDDPKSERALVLLAQAHLQSNHQALAMDNYHKVLTINPGNILAAMPVVENYIGNRQLDRAEATLQTLITENPNFTPGIQRLAQIQIEREEWQSAEKTIDLLAANAENRMMADTLSAQLSMKRGETDLALDAFKKIVETDATQGAAIAGVVQGYENEQNRDALISYLSDLVKKNPDNVQLLASLGAANMRAGNFSDALNQTENALGMQPGSVYLHGLRAEIYERMGDDQAALQSYVDSRQQLPESEPIMLGQASFFEKRGRVDDAKKVYEDLLKINPNNELAINNLAALLSDYPKQDGDIERSRKLVESLQNSAQPYFQDTYAWSLLKNDENPAEALRLLQQVVNRADNIAIFRYHLGVAYNRSAQPQKAREELEKALELAKQNGSFIGEEEARKLLNTLAQSE